MYKIVYKNGNDVVVLFPNLNCGLSLEEIADKDVPKGSQYKIVEADEDETRLFLAWDVDISEPDGYGGDYGEGTDKGISEIAEEGLVLTNGEVIKRKNGSKVYSKCKPVINKDKAKLMLHRLRRELRAREMKPYDEIIAQNRPEREEAEIKRQKIREENAELQSQIDLLDNVEMMKRLARRLENGE